MHGNIKFEDEKNGITGYLNIGGVRKRPKDYFEGYIERKGVKVCETIFGNYMGYADFDGERLFDLRHQHITPVTDLPLDSPYCLQSDSRARIDLMELNYGDVELAQENKNTLEVI